MTNSNKMLSKKLVLIFRDPSPKPTFFKYLVQKTTYYYFLHFFQIHKKTSPKKGFRFRRLLVPKKDCFYLVYIFTKQVEDSCPIFTSKSRPNHGSVQTCFCQPFRMSHFGELPDVVCQKLLNKFKKMPKITNI